MILIDWLVLGGYFLLMAGIGVWSMRKVKGQEDYFMGGRGFGKILQTFAAFGAGTGSAAATRPRAAGPAPRLERRGAVARAEREPPDVTYQLTNG
ncbi:MAG: hypothetical protein IIC52_11285 [Proteobacteria bacterium]|nr:hypothetical protein [Pseudomonadota bacterium]